MRPFLVTAAQAGKLPRWGLLLLCGLYLLPGFVGRDPWRQDDAASFGIALTMARGGPADWLSPNIAGEPVYGEGPLPFWLAAIAIRLLPFVSAHTAARAMAVAGLALMLVALWYATYQLARRPGVQPTDPFGASASRIDFARAIADSALLVLLGTIGVIARVHETTGEAAQICLSAFYLYGAARALERPRSGGLIAGLAIAASVATQGPYPALALLLTTLLLPALSPAYRLIARPWLACALPACALGAVWPLLLTLDATVGRATFDGWLAWHASLAGGPSTRGALYLLRTLPWYFWPAWPIALWALLRWRGRLGEPAVALPLLALACMFLVAVSTAGNGDAPQLLPLALPAAMLASLGLPTLRRGVVSLIDWFAVMTYSLIGLAVWAYWIALVVGYPPRMAYRAGRIAPGFVPEYVALDIVLGSLATVAWLLLVRWRISRQPPMIWRAVVLSGSGLVLAWFLLMTLWLPVFNQRNTYRDVTLQAAATLPPGYRCVAPRGLGPAQRASLYYFGDLRFGATEDGCDWLLIQDDGPAARTDPSPEPGWILRWAGSRPRDPDERLRLYARDHRR
ncbi:MAG TPA: glycosyltransferase family 39 protein [Quisquiliibacterium sp.]|nr:glycosyltransferase family 39 protein [Quisquiliibacterium sp.]HQD81486.1 glycosyltransferase family 39 protein [Quisquiliibacterium sp.]